MLSRSPPTRVYLATRDDACRTHDKCPGIVANFTPKCAPASRRDALSPKSSPLQPRLTLFLPRREWKSRHSRNRTFDRTAQRDVSTARGTRVDDGSVGREEHSGFVVYTR